MLAKQTIPVAVRDEPGSFWLQQLIWYMGVLFEERAEEQFTLTLQVLATRQTVAVTIKIRQSD